MLIIHLFMRRPAPSWRGPGDQLHTLPSGRNDRALAMPNIKDLNSHPQLRATGRTPSGRFQDNIACCEQRKNALPALRYLPVGHAEIRPAG